MKFKIWWMAARPKTLTAALIPVFVGSSLAFSCEGKCRLLLSVFAFLSALFIQIGTNLINDAIDFEKGADTRERRGPRRVTQGGLLSPQEVWRGGLSCFAVAALLSIPLVMAGGKVIILIGILSLIAGYLYTGGPYSLAYTGLGDLFVLIFFGWVAVGGVFYLNTGLWDVKMAIAGTQVGLLATVMIAINNLRDYRTDQKAAKKTLAVRFGPTFARCEITALCLLPFIVGAYWFQNHFAMAFALPCIMLPWAIQLIHRIWTIEPGRLYNRFLGQGAFLHLSFGVLLSIGLILGSFSVGRY